jgi:hypothetical protein
MLRMLRHAPSCPEVAQSFHGFTIVTTKISNLHNCLTHNPSQLTIWHVQVTGGSSQQISGATTHKSNGPSTLGLITRAVAGIEFRKAPET